MEPALLSQSFWLALPSEVRAKLVVLFDFPEKGNVNVTYGPNGPVVTSDGYTYEHLKLITIERMNEMLGTDETDFYKAFQMVVDDLDELMNQKNNLTREEYLESLGGVTTIMKENLGINEEEITEEVKKHKSKKNAKNKETKAK